MNDPVRRAVLGLERAKALRHPLPKCLGFRMVRIEITRVVDCVAKRITCDFNSFADRQSPLTRILRA